MGMDSDVVDEWAEERASFECEGVIES